MLELLFTYVPYEVVVNLAVVVEERDEEEVVGDEAASNERVGEVFNTHRISVQVKIFIQLNLIFLYLSFSPLFLIKCSK